ncbi:hypothetical protein BOO69_02950 [Sulfitobacter alexandrii]|uniref:Thiamine pyrophosphate-binding protein n=2 Tax=Sulfitobacter alexandrii TaxID=1917485 RepID=A0A1J0WLV3_9RHOB|nr:hypothetical protein BOO69_02950 [Sulfitobacter alexandrii]
MAEALKHLGVSHVFFMDAILRPTLVEMEELGIARIMAHAEKSAAYMADGYARVTGRVGVCMCQSVGAANLAAGLQDARLHRAPVVALTGKKEAMLQYRNAYQEVPHAPLFAPVTKASMAVDEPAALPHLLAQAFRTAGDSSPGPVHLDLDGLGGERIEQGDLTGAPVPDPALGALPRHRPHAGDAVITAAAERIRSAKRPVFVVGAGALQVGAQAALRKLAEACDIPVATSLGGRGILPTDHPLHIGTVGSYSAPPANRLVSEADLVIFVGCHAGDQPTHAYTVPAPGTPIVQIDLDGQEIGRNYPDTLPVWGCPAQALADLHDQLGSSLAPRQDWASHAGGVVAAWREEMRPHTTSDATPIRVERLCTEIASALPENAVLVADTGYSGIWTATVLDLPHAGQTYLRAAGSLGWAFPAALGAQVGAPDRPVVCFSGDGAFYYHLSELETQRRWNIPVVTVINNNSGFGQGVYKVRGHYGDRPGNPDEINRFGPTDFAAIARDFGVKGIRIEDPADLAPALERAIAGRKPVLLDVVTDIHPRAPEPWQP